MLSEKSRLKVLIIAIAGAAAGLGGCTETDSFLFDPSVTGRWERTPTTVPILRRIGSIEGPEAQLPEATDPTEADLIPEIFEYRIEPGDGMNVTIFDIPNENQQIDYQRVVDPRGMIELPQLGQIYVNGMTSAGAEEAIKEKMKILVARPMAAVLVAARRADQYSVFGGVQTPGPFRIATSNFRLLEAMSAAGAFSESTDFIYVIRQVSLTDAASGRPGPNQATPKTGDKPGVTGEQLIDTINRLSQPDPGKPATPTAPRPEAPKPEEPKPENKPGGSPGMMQPAATGGQPPIDLVPAPGEKPKAEPQPPTQPDDADTSWVNVDGKWVRVKRPARPEGAPAPLGMPVPGDQLVTQRIIRVPVNRLVAGDASVNIIIRPGDVIRVPPSPPGTLYLGGQVSRPGAYGLSEGLTLQRLIPAGGGLTGLAAPDRVDITRMVGPDRQATIRLNLRAIIEGTHPDVFLKANDLINVGSNFWALPAAVIRNGFRMTYGFGFLVDRNFGNDVFGAPPTNSLGQ
jgi:polysaccharide biosynthesis/export protein